MTKQRHSELLFVVVAISVIAIVFVGALSYIQTNPPMSNGPVFVKQLAIQTQIWTFPNLANGDGTVYEWSFSITNEGRTPIIAINAMLDMSGLPRSGQSQSAQNLSYVLNQFLISKAMGPPATNFVRNPPLPFVGPTIPLFLNDTAGNGMILFRPPPYLQLGEPFPVAITVTYANGTLSNVAVSAHVAAVP